jgi:hypothetical protein
VLQRQKSLDVPIIQKAVDESRIGVVAVKDRRQIMTILMEFGVESRIEEEDYLQGLSNVRKAW